MTPQIDFIWDDECPNVPVARSNLLNACEKVGLKAQWREWRVDDSDLPEHVRGYGSPTILINGVDVAGISPTNAESCRIYIDEDGSITKAPSIKLLANILDASQVRKPATVAHFSIKSTLTMLPSIGIGLLPKVACPACWPAYAGILSSIGLGFLIETAWLLPLTAVFLAIALGTLVFRAQRRNGYKPFLVGLLASVILMVGKFAFDSESAMYVGVGLLVVASVWNTWPTKYVSSAPCPGCVIEAQTIQ